MYILIVHMLCRMQSHWMGNGNTSLLRFHICDAIPFQNQFEGFLEKYNDNGWSVNATCEYTVTPFWYVLHDGNQVDPYQ